MESASRRREFAPRARLSQTTKWKWTKWKWMMSSEAPEAYCLKAPLGLSTEDGMQECDGAGARSGEFAGWAPAPVSSQRLRPCGAGGQATPAAPHQRQFALGVGAPTPVSKRLWYVG